MRTICRVLVSHLKVEKADVAHALFLPLPVRRQLVDFDSPLRDFFEDARRGNHRWISRGNGPLPRQYLFGVGKLLVERPGEVPPF